MYSVYYVLDKLLDLFILCVRSAHVELKGQLVWVDSLIAAGLRDLTGGVRHGSKNFYLLNCVISPKYSGFIC